MKPLIPDIRNGFLSGQPGQALTQHDIKNLMKDKEDLSKVYYTVWTRVKMGQTFTFTFYLGEFESIEQRVVAYATTPDRKGYVKRGVICASHLREISLMRSGTNAEFFDSYMACNPQINPDLLFAYFTSKDTGSLAESDTLQTVLTISATSIFEFKHVSSRLPR